MHKARSSPGRRKPPTRPGPAKASAPRRSKRPAPDLPPERLQKFLSRTGICSRRSGEEYILAGRVAVNGTVVRHLGSKVSPGRDRVTVDGRPVRLPDSLVYVALNKPAGILTSRKDPEGRPCLPDILPPEFRPLFPVGRLDFMSEGLIFLTNDGEFALRVAHPRYRVTKTYLASVRGTIDPVQLRRLTRGVVDEGELLRAQRITIRHATPTGGVLEIELTEGRNREIRRLLTFCHLTVRRLQRIRIGSVPLGNLAPGEWRTLRPSEIASLRSRSAPELPHPPKARATAVQP